MFLVALTIDVPSVLSDTQANLDIIEETGCAFTFPPSSADKLAAYL